VISVVLLMSLGTGPAPSRWPASAGAPVEFVPSAPPDGVRWRSRVVVAFLPAVTFGLSVAPSLELPLFVGAPLRGRRWALGGQLTVSSGLGDRYITGLLAHRYHVTAMRKLGPTGGGLLGVGGGVALLFIQPVIEVEARVGWRIGRRKRGVLGLVARIGWNVGAREQAPVPQLGLMIGGARR
jgi:hypothetical protein